MKCKAEKTIKTYNEGIESLYLIIVKCKALLREGKTSIKDSFILNHSEM